VTPRRARPEEAPLLAALVERAYGPYVPLIGRRPMPMDDDYGARVAAGQAWVLERDGAIAGLVVIEDEPGHLWLDNVAVEPSRHHAGLGRALMEFVEAEARRRGHAEVRLLTNALMTRNIALYARLGYAEIERREEAGFRRVYMAKRVAAG
jgi:GNAT superfamily N-acetyltransferase